MGSKGHTSYESNIIITGIRKSNSDLGTRDYVLGQFILSLSLSVRNT